MKPSQLWGLKAATEDAAKATAIVVASPGTGHINVISPMRMPLPAHLTYHRQALPPLSSLRTSLPVQPMQWPNTVLRAMGFRQ
jgi:hypothetical protein